MPALKSTSRQIFHRLGRPSMAGAPGGIAKAVRKRTCGVLAALALLVGPGVVPPRAAAVEAPRYAYKGLEFRPFLSTRARVEVVDWFDPGAAAAPNNNEDYSFFANNIRFGTEVVHRWFRIHVEAREIALVGLPKNSAGLGPGAVYFANTREQDQRETILRQGFAQVRHLGIEGAALKGGRFIFNEGLERKAADPSLQWLKKMRISQRLIGGFDYTHVGRSFDGGVASFDRGPLNVTFMGGLATRGGFEISANAHMDVDVLYTGITLTEPDWLPRADMRLFHVYYRDGRGLVATDNRPLAVRQADRRDIRLHTIGANLTKVQSAGPGEFDGLVWAAGQTGDWQSQDHKAYALAVETGYRLVDTPWKPWLRAGFFQGSGDDDPSDGAHDTFFQVLPTARLYAQTPFYNLMNNRDLFAQLILKPLANLLVRVDYHYLEVTERRDLLYAGGGAGSDRIFGFGGFPARGDTGIGHFADLTMIWDVNRHLQFWLYYGRAFGKSVIENQFPGGQNLNYAYLEATVRL